MFRKFLLATFVIAFSFLYAQEDNEDLPNRIRISTARYKILCKKCDSYSDVYFRRQVEYSLADGTWWYRKKEGKRFKQFTYGTPSSFTSSRTYQYLDSIFNTFTHYEASDAKFSVYKIELIFYEKRYGLPAKVKTMEFKCRNPLAHPKEATIIEQVIFDYRALLRTAKL